MNVATMLPVDRVHFPASAQDDAALITVVIPTFNRADLVREALDSVAAQSWKSIEIIVVDDGSTDHTGKVLTAWQAAHPACALRVIRQPNSGPSSARNAGAAAARGTFLYFLDSDDLIVPEALAIMAAPLLSGRAPFSLAHVRNTDLRGRPIHDDAEGISRQVPENYFASRWMTHAALYRRSAFEAAGPFDESLRRAEDTEHGWRMLATVGPGTLLNTYIGVRRVHSQGHLCVGRTVAEGARDDLAAARRFLDWAERHDAKSSPICRIVFLRSVIAAVRAGYSRDWTCHDEAVSLLRRADDGVAARRFALTVLSRRSRLIHAPLMLAVASLKSARNGLRVLRQSRKRASPAAQLLARDLNFGTSTPSDVTGQPAELIT